MFWFKKKKEEEKTEQGSGSSDDSTEETAESKSVISGNLEVELTKIKSQLEALNEIRKANAEQFTRTSEQIGELRGALMDSNKAISVIEVASTRAIDLVNSVQPDKLMVEVRKTDGKVEALRANIEANETIMRDILRELKEMRAHMNFYKGVDQVVKMNNEIKQELIDIKKSEGVIGKHADKVETIFVEVEKKFYDFEKFNEAVKELDREFRRVSSDFDKMRVTIEEKADKKEFVKLFDKFSDFEKHTSNILKLLDQRSKNMTSGLNESFNQLKTQLENKFSTKLNVAPISEEKIDSKQDQESGSSGVKTSEKKVAKDTVIDNNSTSSNDATMNVPIKNDTLASPDKSVPDATDNKRAENSSGDSTALKSNNKKEGGKGLFGFMKKAT